MRGKVRRCRFSSKLDRITPAYAGKSPANREVKVCVQDHPRLCGEKLKYFDMDTNVKGSPPPMRGKVKSDNMNLRWFGITPAYAGKRFFVVRNC